MITEFIFGLTLASALILLYISFKFQNLYSGIFSATLFLLLASTLLIGGVSQLNGKNLTTTQNASTVTVLGVTTTMTSITEADINTYEQHKDIPLGITFILFAIYIISAISTYHKEKKSNQDDRV